MYPLHPLEVQLYIAAFTWLAFIIDDTNAQLKPDLDQFQLRLISGQPQPSKLLEAFAEVLRETARYFDAVVANFIILSALAFVNSNALETRSEYQIMKPSKFAINWPYYFRDKEGLAEGYLYFCFHRDLSPKICTFLPAVPDMARFINLTNDILS